MSLNFIASGAGGQGNSQQVRDVVNKLHQGGSRTVYGIVDWDLTNSGNERVKVLGQGNRYSIENYILDPVLVAAFLLREKWIERRMIGLNDQEAYIHVSGLDSSRLQRIADFVVDKVKHHVLEAREDEKLPCHYLSGQVVNLPKWFLQMQGHQLEATLKEVFPELKRFQREPDLKLEILAKVVDDIPSLIPRDLLSLLEEIQDIS